MRRTTTIVVATLEDLEDVMRPFVPLESFVQASGLSKETVRRLVDLGRLTGSSEPGEELFGIFIDTLPSRAQLAELGAEPVEGFEAQVAAEALTAGSGQNYPGGSPERDWTIKW